MLADVDAARAERKAKLAQADALLAGIDDFVLDTLGIAYRHKKRRGACLRCVKLEAFGDQAI